jgi:hypothetical protein
LEELVIQVWSHNEKALEVFAPRTFFEGAAGVGGGHSCSLAVKLFFNATFMIAMIRFTENALAVFAAYVTKSGCE